MFLIGACMTVIGCAGLVASDLARSTLRAPSKVVASAGFVLAALGPATWASAYGRTMLLGLVLGAAGDVLLIPSGRRWFLAGIAAFLAGHVAYATAFWRRGCAPGAAGAALILLVPAAFALWRWLSPHLSGTMRGAVAAYVLVISAMVALAAGTFDVKRSAALLAGAVAFYLSDITVARESFVRKSRWNRALGLPLYYGAQLLLVASIAGG